MKKKLLMFAALPAMILFSCNPSAKEDYSWMKKGIDVASAQLKITAEEIADSAKLPRSIWAGYELDFLSEQLGRDMTTFKDSLRKQPTIEIGQRRLTGERDWTSGFFPGSLWYTYELTGDETLKQEAIKYTNLLYPVRLYNGTHDLGFMMNCSYGNAQRLSPNDSILPVLQATSENLISRFDPKIEAIRSWDFGEWNYPVIIDNMMNLDLLFNVSKCTGDPKYKEVAVKHAYKTMNCHFRPDYSSYHVISYNNDGSVEFRHTHQGKNHESAWARGQSWAVYGYTSCYRETDDKTFLDFAVNIADFIMASVKTDDLIPLWDYDAPDNPDTPRDASAASIVASAFIELSTMVPDGAKYFDYAETILKNLSGEKYLAKVGENRGFILMHSTGSLPNGSEIDVPLNYADYYYMEAIQRYMKLKGLKYENL
ncbi:glycoside hydrolase family 88 protein [Bacteroides sp. OttesenSCG-928-M17]|nr:glycoside hydrolase family 88 protein [Bacteroides sp. OttesenSCG-928-M17]